MKRPFLTILSLLIMLISSSNCISQIVNVESLRKQTDTTGIAGAIALNGSYLDNKKVIYTLSLIPSIQYKWEKDLILLIGDYKITKSEEVNFEDAAFLHFRYSHEFSDLIRWESFTQLQDNKISKLRYRFLIGSGLRLKFLGLDFIRLYLGMLPMYEQEQIENEENTVNKSLRLSQYLSMTLIINDKSSLYSTSYFQPVLGKYADYRFYNEQKFLITFVQNLKLTLSTLYTWDNRAPKDAPERTFLLKTGMQYNF